MAIKIRKHTSQKKVVRYKRKKRIRANLAGTAERPRLAVFRSNAQLYVQLINDETGATLVAASSLEKASKGKIKNTIEGAKALGQLIAQRAKEKSLTKAVFDRSGYIYHGKIRAIADAAREAGLQF